MRQRIQSFGLALVMLLCAGMFVTAAQAQDTPPSPPSGQQGGGRPGMDPAGRAARLQQQLGLTDDVTAKVKDIYTDGTAKMTALRQSGASGDDMRTQMMAIRTDENTRIKALLTPDQATKFDAIASQQRGRGMGGGGGGGGMGGPPPQQ